MIDAMLRSPVCCPRCDEEFSPELEGRWVFVSCPGCGLSIDLTNLIERDGVWVQAGAPEGWSQPRVENTRALISEELLDAVELALEKLEQADERYPDGRQKNDVECFHLRHFLREHELQVGSEQRANPRHMIHGIATAASALRRTMPRDGDAMEAANALASGELLWSYNGRNEQPREPWARAARELRREMSDLSEDAYCAQWLPGQEYTIWHLAFETEDADHPHFAGWTLAATPGRRMRLRELAEEAGGWWSWPDSDEFASDGWVCDPTGSPVFVPLAVWREHVASR